MGVTSKKSEQGQTSTQEGIDYVFEQRMEGDSGGQDQDVVQWFQNCLERVVGMEGMN